MDLDDTPEQAAYRAQVRSWLDEHSSEAPVLSGPGALEDEAEREKVPQVLRVWLRYRSEKYFGGDRTPPGGRKRG